MTQRARERPRQQREHRKAHELDPPRDRDRRGALGRRRAVIGHRPDRIVAPLPPRPREPRSSRLSEHAASATVHAMATPRSRQSARLRARRRRAQQRGAPARPVRGRQHPRRRHPGSHRVRLGLARPPGDRRAASARERRHQHAGPARARDREQRQAPVARTGERRDRDRLPRHAKRCALAASARPAGERGSPRTPVAPHRRQPPRRPVWYQLGEPQTACWTSVRPWEPTSTHRSTARSSRSATRWSTGAWSATDRHPADAGAVGDRVALAPAGRPVAQRRLGGDGRILEARDRRRRSPHSSARHWRSSPTTRATTWRSRCTRGDLASVLGDRRRPGAS